MPRPTRAQGRPGAAVIPTGWVAGHQPAVNKTMTAACTLRQPGTRQSWDAEAEQNLAVPNDPYYEGGARVQALATQAREVPVADDPTTVAQYLVVVDAAAGVSGDRVGPAEGDLVTVAGSGDPLLDGQELRVVQVVMGSLRFERDLFCVLTS